MRTAWPFVTSLAGLTLVGTALVAPIRFHRVEMASETDGLHQDDHKLLGLVPYSTMRGDPRLRVTDDAFRALARAGLPDLPEAHRRLPSYPVARLLYPHRTDYVVQFDLGGRSVRRIAELYARSLRGAVLVHGSIESVSGLCPDGRSRFEFTGPIGTSAPAQLRLTQSPRA